MTVAILGDVDAADAAKIRTFAEEALAALGVDLGVPVRVVDREEGCDWGGWASPGGVFIHADQLAEDDDELRWLVAEEVAHFAYAQHERGGSEYYHELYATWFVCRHCDVEWEPPDDLDEANSYQLGRLVGGALAGSPAARRRLDRVSPTLRVILVDLVDHLDGDAEPQVFARELASYQRDGWGTRGA